MLVPVIAGSDKTTVSVATGHQEYHPVYASSGIISNTARRGHGNGVVPFAFLPIPKGMAHIYSTVNCHMITLNLIYFSKQISAKEAGIPEVLPTTVS
jgi:Plavaka transposase